MKKLIIPTLAVIALSSSFMLAADSTTGSLSDASTITQMNNRIKPMKKMRRNKTMQGGMMHLAPMSDDLRDAIKNNSYEDFVIAFNVMLEQRLTPIQAEFDTMVKKHTDHITSQDDTMRPDTDRKTGPLYNEDAATQHQAIRDAIIANDYTAFVQAWEDATPILPTESEFDTLVEKHASGDHLHNKKGNTKSKKLERRQRVKSQ